MKAAFVVNARDKASRAALAVKGALSQTYPCHILLSDQGSEDGTYEVMEKTLAEFEMPPRKEIVGSETITVPFHKVDLLRCPVKGPYSMSSHNRHMDWLIEQTDAEWIFQCAADDYSLPRRVAACMEAVATKPCSIVATNMFFVNPGEEPGNMQSGVPQGYIPAGQGLVKLVYGSTIHGFHRDFLKKAGPVPAACTMDVYWGYLAALDKGYYVVGEPLHVHYNAADVKNMGFMGKLRGAEAAGDTEELARLNELNRFQLFELYFNCKASQQRLFPLAHQEDQQAALQMMVDQAVGWYGERVKLHTLGITPGTL